MTRAAGGLGVVPAALAGLALLFVHVGCRRHARDDDAPAPGRGGALAEAAPQAAADEPPRAAAPLPFRWTSTPTTTTPAPELAPGEWRGRVRPEDLAPPPPVTVTDRVVTAAPSGRDLAGELRSLLGQPASCMPAGQTGAMPEHVHLSLSANVTGTGVVTSGSVSGNLPPDALACLTARVRAAHFAGDVPDAPRVVSTTADYDRAPQPPAPGAPGTPGTPPGASP